MAINFDNIRYIANGEPWDATVFNRPIEDFVNEVGPAIDEILAGGAYAWEAGTYASGLAVIHNGNIWISKQITTQEPSATASHWKRVITTADNISGATITNVVPTVTTGTYHGHVWYIY